MDVTVLCNVSGYDLMRASHGEIVLLLGFDAHISTIEPLHVSLATNSKTARAGGEHDAKNITANRTSARG